jgi:hypothetical protein
VVNLANSTQNTGDAQGDTFDSIEKIQGSFSADTLIGDDSANVLSGIGGNDRLEGGGGNDTLLGGTGDDRLIGGSGADVLDGSTRDEVEQTDPPTPEPLDHDIASYETSTQGIILDLVNPGNSTGDAAGDTFISIEEYLGSPFDDTLRGNDADNILSGGDGNDTYELDAQTAAGSKIQDSGGSNDILNLSNITLSLSPLESGKAGLARNGNALIIDINKDGVANQAEDLTIEDFFSPRNFSINDVTVTEGNDGITNAVFTVSATSGAGSGGAGFIEAVGNLQGSDILSVLPTVTLNYTTAEPKTPKGDPTNDAATAGTDYNPASGQLTFNESETEKTITVEVIGDTQVEPDETFFVNLSNASNTDITQAQGIGTIKNDDTLISISDVTVTEGNGRLLIPNQKAVFTVSLSGASTETVTVDFEVSSGTALDELTTSRPRMR